MISITMISSKMLNFSYNNKVQKFLKAFRKINVGKIGMPFGTLTHRTEKLARHLARCDLYWHVGK